MMTERTHIEARLPNWLPLPGEEIHAAQVEVVIVDENDLFPKGEVSAWYPRQGTGVVRNVRGEEVPFSLEQIDLVGPKNHSRWLAEGSRVGFDVARTTKGPRVNRMKIY